MRMPASVLPVDGVAEYLRFLLKQLSLLPPVGLGDDGGASLQQLAPKHRDPDTLSVVPAPCPPTLPNVY